MSAVKRRRINVGVACNPCRIKKAACDGRRPHCRRCGSENEDCTYDTRDSDETRTDALKRENEALKQRQREADYLLSRLKTLPDHDSIDLLRRLRDGGDPLFAPGLLTTHPLSEHATARAALPSTSSRLEYELAISHPHSYPPRSPISDQHVPTHPHSKIAAIHPDVVGPSELPHYVDSRLHRLDITYWTSVPLSNEYAAMAISLYLETDHPVLGLFDADLFLADLVGKRLNFCSPLLVISVLFWACQIYAGIDSQASSFCPKLLHEADRLWEASFMKTDSFLSAAALHLLSLGCTGAGKDELGRQFEKEGGAMAQRLGFIGVPSTTINPNRQPAPEMQRALSHTAWGIFNYLILRSIHFREYVVRYPPNFPIPGRQDDEDGRIALHPLPQYMGNTFTLLCEFWFIVQEFALYYYADNSDFGISLQNRVPLAVAETIYQKLLNWADTAAIAAADGKSESHHLAILQIWYHTVIMDIFRPFKHLPLHLSTFAYAESTPADILRASLNQLKRHVVTFPSQHSAAAYAIFWHPACMYVANAALAGTDSDPQWRRYFDLCTLAYTNLSSSFRFAMAVLQGLLTMAIRKGALTPAESRGILEKSWRNGRHWVDVGLDESTSTYKVDLDLAMTSPGAADIASMVRGLNDEMRVDESRSLMDGSQTLAEGQEGGMFDEFTTVFA